MHWLNFDATVIPLSIPGGFAFVFVAQDNVSGKEYALKVWLNQIVFAGNIL